MDLQYLEECTIDTVIKHTVLELLTRISPPKPKGGGSGLEALMIGTLPQM